MSIVTVVVSPLFWEYMWSNVAAFVPHSPPVSRFVIVYKQQWISMLFWNTRPSYQQSAALELIFEYAIFICMISFFVCLHFFLKRSFSRLAYWLLIKKNLGGLDPGNHWFGFLSKTSGGTYRNCEHTVLNDLNWRAQTMPIAKVAQVRDFLEKPTYDLTDLSHCVWTTPFKITKSILLLGWLFHPIFISLWFLF